MPNTLNILNESGDITIQWDPNNADEVKIAEKAFADAVASGAQAYEVVKTFDPKSGEVKLRSKPIDELGQAEHAVASPTVKGGYPALDRVDV